MAKYVDVLSTRSEGCIEMFGERDEHPFDYMYGIIDSLSLTIFTHLSILNSISQAIRQRPTPLHLPLALQIADSDRIHLVPTGPLCRAHCVWRRPDLSFAQTGTPT